MSHAKATIVGLPEGQNLAQSSRAQGHQRQTDDQGVARLRVGRIEKDVVERARRFLEGDFLKVELPEDGGHISYQKKRAMLQMTDLAHKLGIECLQRAAMHAISISILRKPTDWDNEDTRFLIEKVTWEGNPPRSTLDKILPTITQTVARLPCTKEGRRYLCRISEVTTGEDGQMTLDRDWWVPDAD